MTEQQPMKMAAAEALYETAGARAVLASSPSARSTGSSEQFAVEIPCLLSFLATGDFNGEVAGHQRRCRRESEEQYGPGDYRPDHPGHLLVASGS